MSTTIEFAVAPPGFSPHTEFDLAPVDGADGLFALQAVSNRSLRVFLVDPNTVMNEYQPIITDDQAQLIELTSSDDALVLVVANPTDDGVNVNLMAPVVINTAKGRAAQMILEGQDYPIRAALD